MYHKKTFMLILQSRNLALKGQVSALIREGKALLDYTDLVLIVKE